MTSLSSTPADLSPPHLSPDSIAERCDGSAEASAQPYACVYAGALTSARGSAAGPCFAADDTHVVAGGGAKAWRWEPRSRSTPAGAPAGETAADEGDERRADGDAQPHAAGGGRAKGKPRRQAKPEKRLPCRLANR